MRDVLALRVPLLNIMCMSQISTLHWLSVNTTSSYIIRLFFLLNDIKEIGVQDEAHQKDGTI